MADLQGDLHPALKVVIIWLAAGLVNKLAFRKFFPPKSALLPR
jgi:hypothetical protein